MLTLVPLASTLNPPEQVAATVARVSGRLSRHGIEHQFVPAPAPAEAGTALFIATGGTEHLAMSALDGQIGPVVLVAHPEQNSFPAALEILSRLRQLGRPGRIVLLNDADDGLDELARLAAYDAVRRGLASLRLGRIGTPSDWLVGSMPDAETVARVWGPRVIDVPMSDVVNRLSGVSETEAEAVRADFVGGAAAVTEPTASDLDAAARVVVALRDTVREHRLDACAVRCFDLVVDCRTTGCLALSWLIDHGVVAGCEGDVPATVTMAWAKAISGQAGFIANPQDVDRRTNCVWLAHCTIARGMVSRYTLRSHFESSLGVGIEGRIDPGPATLVRIGGADLRDLFVSDADVVATGDRALRCRTQVEVRLASDAGVLLTRPAGNHHVLIQGHWAARLREYFDWWVAPKA